jgi:predicted Zn-dependent protease
MATLLSFNRDQERAADEAALSALHAEYGHVGGAIDLFEVFARLPNEQRSPNVPAVEFLRTHPLTANRITAIRQWAADNGAAIDGPRRPLPSGIAALRK